MTRIVVIGGGTAASRIAAVLALSSMPAARVVIESANQAEIDAAIAALGLAAIKTVEQYREVVLAMGAIDVPTPHMPPAPAFGGNRPYLKKKKGRS